MIRELIRAINRLAAAIEALVPAVTQATRQSRQAEIHFQAPSDRVNT